MIYIIALILVIPTYGLSLVVLFAYLCFRANSVGRNIEASIKSLATEKHTIVGSCFPNISYNQVISYIDSHRGDVTYRSGTYIDFNIILENKKYAVSLNKEPLGLRAILSAKDITWLDSLYKWLKYKKGVKLNNPSELFDVKRLILGRAVDCFFSEEELKVELKRPATVLPSELFNLTELEELHLQGNRIEHLPTEIGQLTNLKDLKLSCNLLNKLPSSIGNLKNLETLTIWMNNLIEVPPEIGLLQNLKGLDLSCNPLHKIPEELTMLTHLKKLYLTEMENLILSANQKRWIKKLIENGCDVLIELSID